VGKKMNLLKLINFWLIKRVGSLVKRMGFMGKHGVGVVFWSVNGSLGFACPCSAL
jgi:hypothetical protein